MQLKVEPSNAVENGAVISVAVTTISSNKTATHRLFYSN